MQCKHVHTLTEHNLGFGTINITHNVQAQETKTLHLIQSMSLREYLEQMYIIKYIAGSGVSLALPHRGPLIAFHLNWHFSAFWLQTPLIVHRLRTLPATDNVWTVTNAY